MSNSKENPKAGFFFEKEEKWRAEINELRKIVLSTGLSEEVKWGCPCYTYQEHNIVLIHTFKSYCALLFFKGALLGDTNKILVQQTKNVQSARQLRFKSGKEIAENAAVIKEYVHEAVEVEKAGLQVQLKSTDEFVMPEEFEKKITEMPDLKAAFEALTPGRQRGYLLHFSEAKQSKTREARIEKYIPKILKGNGLND